MFGCCVMVVSLVGVKVLLKVIVLFGCFVDCDL